MDDKRYRVTTDTLATTFAAECSLHLGAPTARRVSTVRFELSGVPLPGGWRVEFKISDTDVKLLISTDAATRGPERIPLDIHVRLEAILPDGELLPIAQGDSLPPPRNGEVWLVIGHDKLRELEAASAGRYVVDEHLAYTLRLGVNVHRSVPLVDPQELVRRLPDESDRPVRDAVVRIAFAAVGAEPFAELWTSSAFLSSSSPYFKTLLRSGFSESVRKGSKRVRTSAAASTAALVDGGDKDFDDSDDETDVALCEDEASTMSPYDVSQHPDLTYTEILVSQTAYSTYRAILRYFQTGFLRFAPLASSCLPVLASAKKSRAERVKELRDAEPALPIPVSPKSTYRLAHLLGCEPLQRACLAELGRQLSVDNAAVELFDQASQTYDEWRKVVLTYVGRKWSSVTASEAWKDVQSRIARDEIPGAAPILMELVSARGCF